MWYMKSNGFSRPSWLRCITVCANVHRTPLSIAAASTMRKPKRWNSAKELWIYFLQEMSSAERNSLIA